MERDIRVETWPLARPFRTAVIERREVALVVAEITWGAHTGRGETFVHERSGHLLADVLDRVRSAPLSTAVSDARAALPPDLDGPARDVLDQALWDLQARRAGKRAWELAGIAMAPVTTAYTIGIAPLEDMQRDAAAHRGWPVLKIKAEPAQALARIDAVRAGNPDAALIVDANESWSPADYRTLAPALAGRGVVLLEQPLPAGQDEALAALDHPVPVCADESFRALDDLDDVRRRYDLVNVKLPKAGGPTAALACARAARDAGLGVFVGCMVSTSLAIAPALLVAQLADYVDLDGPLLLAADRQPGLRFEGPLVHPPPRGLWG